MQREELESNALSGCPRCGCPVSVIKTTVDEGTSMIFSATWYHVECGFCGLEGPMAASGEKAIESWNKAVKVMQEAGYF